jgi:hypothetical protein
MRSFITGVFILFLSCLSFAQNDSTLYSFFVAGHSYGDAGVNNVGFHPPFKNKFSYINSRPEIKFGVLTGDIVAPNPVAQDWDEIDSDIISLGLPVYFTVGNHDMEDRPLFESRYGITYYDFVYENDLFIVLDPNIDGWSIKGVQLQFLKNVLNTKTQNVKNVFVFFHQVMWSTSSNEFNHIATNSGVGKIKPVNFWPDIVPLFNSLSNNVVMFSGDIGVSWADDITYDRYKNISFIATGMGHVDGENFVVVNVDTSKSIDYDIICLSDPVLECLADIEDHLVVNIFTSLNVSANGISLSSSLDGGIITLKIGYSEDVMIQIYSLNGKLILEKNLEDQSQYDINVSSLSKGLYILKVKESLSYPPLKFLVR